MVDLDEPELHLDRTSSIPTRPAGGRRMPIRPDTAYFPLAPDWICEVLAASTAQIDRVRKLTIYARERVTHAWLVDRLAQTLEVLRLEGGHWLLLSTHAGSEIVRAEPFHEIEIPARGRLGHTSDGE